LERRYDGGVAPDTQRRRSFELPVAPGGLDIYVPCAPLKAGKIDQPYGGLAHG